MPVLQILRWLLLGAEIYITLPILYKCTVAVAAIIAMKRRKTDDFTAPLRTNFAILIPAHNEESLLGLLLENLAELAYPKDKYTVYVVADNCTDNTAEVARTSDWVRVYERFDQTKRSKGYALAWILEELEASQLIYDAYVIIDADSVVAPNFLCVMERELLRGAHALQARYTVLNASDSASTALRWISMTLHNHVRPLGRNALGSSSPLLGNGMCLSRSLLIRHPWQTYSASEDYQYYLTIMQDGEHVRYVVDTEVRSHMPTKFAHMRSQDIRWETLGSSRMVPQFAYKLLCAGLRLHDLACIEAIGDLLTPPLSFLAFWCLLTLITALLFGTTLQLLWCLLLVSCLIGYVGTAFYLLRPPHSVYKALLLYAPAFMLWKVWVILVISRKQRISKWVRTSRPNEVS